MAGYVTLNPATTLVHGAGTAGTAVAQLESSGRDLIQVSIRAMPSNSGTVYVGGSGVTTSDGWPLLAGESIDIGIDNTDSIYLIASAASQLYRWLGLPR